MIQHGIYRIACLAALVPTSIAYAAALSRRRGPGRGSIFLQGTLLCAIGVLAFSFLELMQADAARIALCSHFTYFFIAFAFSAWFLFALQFGTGRKRIPGWVIAAVSIVPSLVSISAFLDDSLHLIWRDYSIESYGSIRAVAVRAYGPVFWVHVVYSYGLYLIGAIIVLRQVVGHFDVYKRQAAMIVTATGLPIIPNILYVFRLVPGQTRDFSPLAIAFTCILFTICIRKYGLLELNPAPRERIADYLDEGVVIVDERRRIVHCNEAAAAILAERGKARPIGRTFEDVFPSCPPSAFEAEAGPGRWKSLRLADRDGKADLSMSVKVVDPGRSYSFKYCVVLRPFEIPSEPSVLGSLSRRELEVLSLLTSGLTLKKIASRLYVSENTVKTHVRHIYEKTGADNRRTLARLVVGFPEELPSPRRG